MCVIWNECASIKTASNQFAPFTRHRTQPINVSAGAATKGVGEGGNKGSNNSNQSEANPVSVCAETITTSRDRVVAGQRGRGCAGGGCFVCAGSHSTR